MKKFKKIIIMLMSLCLAMGIMFGCDTPDNNYGDGHPEGSTAMKPEYDGEGGNEFNEIIERDFVDADVNNQSAFRLSVSTASYSYARRNINEGYKVDKNSIRVEEFINYFNYNVDAPETGVFNGYSNVYPSPWNEGNLLLRLSVRAKQVKKETVASNLVFLIDTSGSMYGADRLDLVTTAFSYMVQGLGENDRISLVTYAGSAQQLLTGERGSEKQKILSALDGLKASGGTAGSDGLSKAYKLAEANYIDGGNNRVILATDGDFNIGNSTPAQLSEQIASYRDKGIYFTGIGVGYGNYKDNTMEDLAKHGNGNAFYLDNETEAKKIFSEGLTGTLFTVAKDAKAQITFNLEVVSKYRLVGYDNLRLSKEEFEDESTDAGEVGSNHLVTVLYEIVPKNAAIEREDSALVNYATAEIRYKDVDTNADNSVQYAMQAKPQNADDKFIACVAEGAMLLRESKFKGSATFNGLLNRLSDINLNDEYKQEFKNLMQKAMSIYSK